MLVLLLLSRISSHSECFSTSVLYLIHQGSEVEEQVEPRIPGSGEEEGEAEDDFSGSEEGLEAEFEEFSGSTILWFYVLLSQYGRTEKGLDADARLMSCECGGWHHYATSVVQQPPAQGSPA